MLNWDISGMNETEGINFCYETLNMMIRENLIECKEDHTKLFSQDSTETLFQVKVFIFLTKYLSFFYFSIKLYHFNVFYFVPILIVTRLSMIF